ncbi:MAG: UDP-glucose 4-epimerase GalE [Coriobacteriales bacterium]|nr:UDP-glucose 4-epimerase GalE [Coriobacteriales bacterium]
MKVLVAGGAGYIGSHVVFELIRDGHEVVVYDNLSTGRRSAVPEGVRFIEGDIRDLDATTRALAQGTSSGSFDVALHFAAKLVVPESVSNPLAYYHNNVEGLRTMLEAMVKTNVRTIVFSSTAAVYGEPDKSHNGECLEGDLTVPINPYGETKLAAEKMIQWVAQAHDMNYCILRYFNVAGADASLRIGLDKDQLTHLIPLIMQTALGLREKLQIYGNDYDTIDGTCVRDYIHVSDLARAHILGAKYILDNDRSVLCNLGSGQGFSVKQVVDAALKMFEFAYEYAPRRDGDPAKLIANNQRAQELLGWQPQLSLEQMLSSDFAYRQKISTSSHGEPA